MRGRCVDPGILMGRRACCRFVGSSSDSDGKDDKGRRMRCCLISRLLQQKEEYPSYSQRYHEGEINT